MHFLLGVLHMVFLDAEIEEGDIQGHDQVRDDIEMGEGVSHKIVHMMRIM